jgi:hypothetical protein
VATVCVKCGAELHPGSEFCSVCGTPVATVAAAPLAASMPIDALPPMAKKKSHLVLKVVLGVVGVVVLAFVGLIVLGSEINRRAQLAQTQAAASQGTASATPPASTSAAAAPATITASDLGMPLYPGSTLDPGGAQTTTTATMRVVQATLWTNDSPSTVAAYYQTAMGSQVTVMGLGDETILSAGTGNDKVTMMIDSESGKTKMLVIHSVSSGT